MFVKRLFVPEMARFFKAFNFGRLQADNGRGVTVFFSRPFGTSLFGFSIPGAEAPGYFRSSLRDLCEREGGGFGEACRWRIFSVSRGRGREKGADFLAIWWWVREKKRSSFCYA